MLRGSLTGILPQAYHNTRLLRNLWQQPAHHKFAGLVQCALVASDRATPANSCRFMPLASVSEAGKAAGFLGDEFSDITGQTLRNRHIV